MSYRRIFSRVAVLSLAASSLALASCATPTTYHPATGAGQYSTGYSDQQLETNRWRVSFAGNSLTSRETVERYLLYRAAELTLQQGNDYFILVDRDTEKHTDTYADPQPFGYGPWGGWAPYWRFHGRWGWRSWDPFFDRPYWNDGFDIRTVDRYEAVAEILMGKGPKPADNVRAFDAHDVVAKLGPTIKMPQPK